MHWGWLVKGFSSEYPRRSSRRKWWQIVHKKLQTSRQEGGEKCALFNGLLVVWWELYSINLFILEILLWFSNLFNLLLSSAKVQRGSSNGKMLRLPWHDNIKCLLQWQREFNNIFMSWKSSSSLFNFSIQFFYLIK